MKSVALIFLGIVSSVAIGADFNPRQVVKPFAAITDPETVPATQAGKWVSDRELVIGVVVNGEARAYPINQLTNPTREIINDTLGDRSIAATW